MYPFVRMIKEFVVHRNAPPLKFGQTHVSYHMCMPWDLDIWMELNNGRTLTIYDLGRLVLAQRAGMVKVLRQKRWNMTMAGAVVRYRRRIRIFERIEMRSRAICWDSKFVYIEQSMWKRDGECAGHIVYRSAFVDKNGIVNPDKVGEALGYTGARPEIPNWIEAWRTAEDQRPWPPMQEELDL